MTAEIEVIQTIPQEEKEGFRKGSGIMKWVEKVLVRQPKPVEKTPPVPKIPVLQSVVVPSDITQSYIDRRNFQIGLVCRVAAEVAEHDFDTVMEQLNKDFDLNKQLETKVAAQKETHT